MKQIGIGKQSYSSIRERDNFYIDKTNFIKEWWEADDAEDEEGLRDTVASALQQIQEKQYDADLLAKGFAKEQIRHYGFAFRGKEVLIG